MVPRNSQVFEEFSERRYVFQMCTYFSYNIQQEIIMDETYVLYVSTVSYVPE